MAALAASLTKAGPGKSGNPWPRLIAACWLASRLISANTEVPKLRTRGDATSLLKSVDPLAAHSFLEKSALCADLVVADSHVPHAATLVPGTHRTSSAMCLSPGRAWLPCATTLSSAAGGCPRNWLPPSLAPTTAPRPASLDPTCAPVLARPVDAQRPRRLPAGEPRRPPLRRSD